MKKSDTLVELVGGGSVSTVLPCIVLVDTLSFLVDMILKGFLPKCVRLGKIQDYTRHIF